jgi:hypothetical protein
MTDMDDDDPYGDPYDDYDVDAVREASANRHYRWWLAYPNDVDSLRRAVDGMAGRGYRPLRFPTGSHPASVHIQQAGDLIDIAIDIAVGVRNTDGTRPDGGLPGQLDVLPGGRSILAGHLAGFVTHARRLLDSQRLSAGPDVRRHLDNATDAFARAAASLEHCRQKEQQDAEAEPTVEDLLAQLREPATTLDDPSSPVERARRRAVFDWTGQAVPAMRLAEQQVCRHGIAHREQLQEILAQMYATTRRALGLAHTTGHTPMMLRRPEFPQIYDRWYDVATELTHCVYHCVDCLRTARGEQPLYTTPFTDDPDPTIDGEGSP